MSNVEDKTKRVEAENEKLKKVTERLNHLLETSDIEAIMREQADLLCSFSDPIAVCASKLSSHFFFHWKLSYIVFSRLCGKFWDSQVE